MSTESWTTDSQSYSHQTLRVAAGRKSEACVLSHDMADEMLFATISGHLKQSNI